MGYGQAFAGNGSIVQLINRLGDTGHGLDDIGPGFTHHIEGNRRLAQLSDPCGVILVAELDIGDVTDRHPGNASGDTVGL